MFLEEKSGKKFLLKTSHFHFWAAVNEFGWSCWISVSMVLSFFLVSSIVDSLFHFQLKALHLFWVSASSERASFWFDDYYWVRKEFHRLGSGVLASWFLERMKVSTELNLRFNIVKIGVELGHLKDLLFFSSVSGLWPGGCLCFLHI